MPLLGGGPTLRERPLSDEYVIHRGAELAGAHVWVDLADAGPKSGKSNRLDDFMSGARGLARWSSSVANVKESGPSRQIRVHGLAKN